MNTFNQIPLSRDELIFGVLILFLTTFLVAESRWSRLYNDYAISSDKSVHIFLDDQTNIDTLSRMLADSGLVSDKSELLWAANLLGWQRFQQGHYHVKEGFTYDAFLSKLARGIQDPVKVTILPGQTKERIAGAVSGQLQFDSLSFQQTITDTAFLQKNNLDPKEVIGRLYPNTYSVYWTTGPESFFERVQREFNRSVVAPNKQRFRELDRSVNEILALASIVEWEASTESEKAIISGLYWNRLERGMRLQADPTVNYAVGERRRLLFEDYKIDHPYNTYIHRGLPPGPITNPSKKSIEAALYPADHDYLYMVASPDGTHSFSRTFEEHKRKSAEWREWIQKQYRIKRQRNSE
ncbi:MAG: endolytic transglycosylase MltG [Fodinibius sp.]|nr:endolytic transglycosylase MltG [Fodinibius sp.]